MQKLMQELQEDTVTLVRQLSPETAPPCKRSPEITEKNFRWLLNDDAMATEKLAEGIRNFAIDQGKLEHFIIHMDCYSDRENQAIL